MPDTKPETPKPLQPHQQRRQARAEARKALAEAEKAKTDPSPKH